MKVKQALFESFFWIYQLQLCKVIKNKELVCDECRTVLFWYRKNN